MKILVVYYSRTGLTKKVGERLVQALNADQEVITTADDRGGVVGYLKCGREAVTKISPVINPAKLNSADYDLVIIGTPVWAATMASPIRTYLTEQKDKLKRVAFFVTQGGSGANRTIDNMAEICGLRSESALVLLSREVAKDSYADKLQRFVEEINSKS